MQADVTFGGEFEKRKSFDFRDFFGFEKSIYRFWNPNQKMESKNCSRIFSDAIVEFSVKTTPRVQIFMRK